MPASAGSPSPGSSPAGSGIGFSTPDAGRDLIHAAQLGQLREYLGQLDETTPGFGAELQATFPSLPEDDSLLGRSRRELASLAAGLHSDLQIYQNPTAGSLLGAFRLSAASQHLDGITTWLCQLVLAHLPWLFV